MWSTIVFELVIKYIKAHSIPIDLVCFCILSWNLEFLWQDAYSFYTITFIVSFSMQRI